MVAYERGITNWRGKYAAEEGGGRGSTETDRNTNSRGAIAKKRGEQIRCGGRVGWEKTLERRRESRLTAWGRRDRGGKRVDGRVEKGRGRVVGDDPPCRHIGEGQTVDAECECGGEYTSTIIN